MSFFHFGLYKVDNLAFNVDQYIKISDLCLCLSVESLYLLDAITPVWMDIRDQLKAIFVLKFHKYLNIAGYF